MGESLNSTYFVLGSKPNRSRMRSSGNKLNNGSYLENSIKDPSVGKFGLVVNGESASVKCSSSIVMVSIWSFQFSSS